MKRKRRPKKKGRGARRYYNKCAEIKGLRHKCQIIGIKL